MFKKVAIFMVLVASVAFAGFATAETNNESGVLCKGTDGVLRVSTTGQAYNNTSSTITAVCPVERSAIDGNFGKKLKAKLFVLDRNPDSDVCCRVKSRTPNGNTIQSAQVCSSGSSSSYQTLNTAEISQQYTFGNFYVQCTVPPKYNGSTSRIITYRAYVNK